MFRVSLLVIFVTILGFTSATPDQCLGECPAFYPDNDVYLIPHEDCNKFCSCVYGTPVEMICPPGLHYSEDARTCADPASAKCIRPFNSISEQFLTSMKLRTIDSDEDNDIESDCLSACPSWSPNYNEVAVIIAHRKCHKFCRCHGANNVIVQTCPKNLHFNLEIGGCTTPADANCQGIIDDTPPNADDCECPGEPTTTERTTSTESTIPSTKPTTTTKLPPWSTTTLNPDASGCIGSCVDADGGDDVVQLPHENCRQFCKCDFGLAYVFTCPQNLHYNPKLRVCDRPSVAGCTGSKPPPSSGPSSPDSALSTPSSSSPPSEDTSGCLGTCPTWEGADVVQLPHKDCTKFCKCDFGVPHVMTCKNGLHFNPILGVCDRPSSAGCIADKPTPSGPTSFSPNSTTTSTPSTPSTPSGDTLGCIGSCVDADGGVDVVQLPHKDCRKFCKCDFGLAYVFTCPHNLHYNPKKRVCDRPNSAHCTGTGGKPTVQNQNDIAQKNVMGYSTLFRW